MKKHNKLLIVLFLTMILLVGCNQASRVSHNISKEANNFNVQRRLVTLNLRSDKVIFEAIGSFSILNNGHGELEVIAQTGPNTYKKHMFYINEPWETYYVEDISGANVDPYKFEINVLPEMIQPITITSSY